MLGKMLSFPVAKFKNMHYSEIFPIRVKVGVLCPVQQPGSYWDRSSALQLVGGQTPTEATTANIKANFFHKISLTLNGFLE